MKLLATFEVLGKACTPWSVPNIGTGHTKSGRRFRFARRKNNDLDEWKEYVAQEAKRHFRQFSTKPIKLRLEFLRRTPPGKKHGQIWEIPIERRQKKNKETGEIEVKWVKKGIRGQSSPDLCNLFKGTEDALQDIAFANDAQTCEMESIRLYAPLDGVRVAIFEIEPWDYPGYDSNATGL